MTTALLLALLAPATAAAGTVVRAGVELRTLAASDHGAGGEVVAAIMESSLGGSAIPLDAERTYPADRGSPAPASRRQRTASRAASPAPSPSSAVTPGRLADGAQSPAPVTAEVSRHSAGNGATGQNGTGESVVGFWLLLVAGIAGALLFAGAGLRTDAARRR